MADPGRTDRNLQTISWTIFTKVSTTVDVLRQGVWFFPFQDTMYMCSNKREGLVFPFKEMVIQSICYTPERLGLSMTQACNCVKLHTQSCNELAGLW